jgi:hypothetical protein
MLYIVLYLSINKGILSYYGLLSREPLSYSVVWVGIVPKPDNTIGERFPRERYIINLVHRINFINECRGGSRISS